MSFRHLRSELRFGRASAPPAADFCEEFDFQFFEKVLWHLFGTLEIGVPREASAGGTCALVRIRAFRAPCGTKFRAAVDFGPLPGKTPQIGLSGPKRASKSLPPSGSAPGRPGRTSALGIWHGATWGNSLPSSGSSSVAVDPVRGGNLDLTPGPIPGHTVAASAENQSSSVQIWSTPGQARPSLADVGPTYADIGPSLVDLGTTSDDGLWALWASVKGPTFPQHIRSRCTRRTP